MKKQITLFPTIGANLLKEMEYIISVPKAYYESNGERKELELEVLNEAGSEYAVTDNSGSWEIQACNLVITGDIEIENLASLFEEGGVTSKSSTLAIGIVWKSKSTDMRGAEKLASFSYEDKKYFDSYSYTFDKASIREGVEFSIVVYLENYLDNKCFAYAQVPGTILGELAKFDFVLEGNGSQFTVVEKYSPKIFKLYRFFPLFRK